jgi:hypothetical protein
VLFPPHTAYNELVGFHTPNGTPRVPSPTPPYFHLYYQADVLDYFIDPDSLIEHFAGTTLSVEPTPNLSSVPGAFSPSPSSPNLLSPLLPSSSAPAVSGGSQDGLTSNNSEDEASSVDAHLSASSQTSPVPVPYTPAQQIIATNPTIRPLITTLAPLVTVWGCWETLPCLLMFSSGSTGDKSGRSRRRTGERAGLFELHCCMLVVAASCGGWFVTGAFCRAVAFMEACFGSSVPE